MVLPPLTVFGTAQFVNWTRAVWLGCVPGALLFLVALAAQRDWRINNRPIGLLVLLLLSISYGYGVVRELNIILDRSQGNVYQSAISKTYAEQGIYGLNVAPGATGVDNITVPLAVYRSVQVGGPICLVRKEGAFGINWYTAQACPWRGGTLFP